MNSNYFTLAGARQQLGRRIHAAFALGSVPAGTTGTVAWIEESDLGCYGVVVRWDLKGACGIATDTFTKSSFFSACRLCEPESTVA